MTENNGNQKQIEWNFKSSSNWAAGVALIIVGGLFLLNSLGIINVYLMNWWMAEV